jgi:hypothetical protein
MKIKPLIFTFIVFVHSTHAHVGETKEQCDIRYGKPINIIRNDTVLYKKGQFVIIVTFYQNKPRNMGISKWKDNHMIDIPMSDIETILKSNSNNSEWVESKNNPFINGRNAQMWKTIDNKIDALYDRDRKELTVIDGDNLRAYLANKKSSKTVISNDVYGL